MKIVALILARGGSKGIKNKNIIDINGKPLVSYVIEAAKDSIVEETWVSTDNEEIATIASSYGAKIHHRPPELATDKSKNEDTLLHFAKNVSFDVLVHIQPTSPLLKSKHITEATHMIDDGYDSVFSAYKEHWLPRWEEIGDIVVPHRWNLYDRPMRQDVKHKFVENGAIYVTTRESLLKNQLRYGGNIGIYEMSANDSFQIDTNDDLELIKRLL